MSVGWHYYGDLLKRILSTGDFFFFFVNMGGLPMVDQVRFGRIIQQLMRGCWSRSRSNDGGGKWYWRWLTAWGKSEF
jgi:hypothetical protein